MDLLLIFTQLTLIVFTIYVYIKWRYSYWARKNLNFVEPKLFQGIGAQVFDSYKRSRRNGEKHGGCFAYLTPIYVPADLNIIKHIMQIDFNNFMNRDVFVNEDVDPLRGHLFNLPDQRWKGLRTKLTPTFSSGKMKMMFHTLADTATGFAEILRSHSTSGDPIDIKSVVTRYTTDSIISCAFGVKCNSLQDPESEFLKFGDMIFKQLGFRQKMLYLLPKSLMSACKVRLTDSEVQRFLVDFVKNVVEYREKNNILQNDFMHLLVQLKNLNGLNDTGKILSEDKKTGNFFTIDEIAAQCYLFFVAGFETSATTLTCALYELAQNQTLQDKLRKEINSVLQEFNGSVTYEAVMKMELLDKVVNETLRKHPPVIFITRVCKKDYKIPDTDVSLDAGTTVVIPFKAIHEDPEYYPNPQVFDPERFNKHDRPAYSFLPFGEGPRICIGARFGYIQVKIGLIAILSKFRISLNRKTAIPIKRSNNFIASVVDKVWLNVEEI